jgi:trimeric autotransporter adhesin
MATYTHTANAVSYRVAWYDVELQFLVDVTSTLIVLHNSDGTETRIIGTGFPGSGGTVTEIDRTSSGGGTLYETVTGITGVSLGALGDALDAGGNRAFFALISNAADTFNGFSGNDLFIGGPGGAFNGGAGTDTVSYDHALSAVRADLGDAATNTGSDAVGDTYSSIENLVRSDISDIPVGNAQANVLTGGAGADIMIGGLGNDTYFVDNAGDAVIENPGEGTNTVNASISSGLVPAVDNSVLLGSADLQGFGNSLAMVITGSSGNNLIDGRTGADLMIGGGGNDSYSFDNAGDAVIENANRGNEAVSSSVSFALPATAGSPMTILTIAGTGRDDTIVVNAIGIDSGTYSINGGPAIAFSGVTRLVVSGGDGNDTLTIVNPTGSLFAPTDGISYDGGGQPADTLEVLGGTATDFIYTAGATHDAGTLVHTGEAGTQTIDFAGIAPIIDTVAAPTFTIKGTAGADAITIENVFVGGVSMMQVSSPTFESISFANKATVTINGLGGGDTVMFQGQVHASGTGLTTLNLTGVDTVLPSGLFLQVPNLSISASGDVILPSVAVNVLAASVGGRFYCVDGAPLVIGSVGGISGITAAISGSSGFDDLLLQANNLDIQQQINAGSGIVTLAPLDFSETISLGGADSAGVLGLTDAELDHVTASVLRIGSPGVSINQGDLALTGQITSDGHYDTLSLATGGAILDGTVGEQTDITVNNLALRAGTDVGSLTDGLDVAVSNLAFDNVSSGGSSGDVSVANAGPLTIGAVDGLVSSSSAGAFVQVRTIGALTIAAPIATTGGSINLQTIDTAAAGDDLTVLAGVTLQSSVGSVGLAAGDNLMLQPGSIVQAATFAELLVDVLNADAGVGATASLNGTVIATSVSIGGGADADTLIGTALGEFINGGAGADLMIGGAGDDIYLVDNAGDAVLENASEGTDTVLATAHFALPANVENLTLRGVADLQGYGNGLANTVTGNAGNNLINGGAGADSMIGRGGNDTYFVDNGGDAVIEIPGEGTDTVFSTINFALPAEVEILVLQGGADLQGYGNELINTLYGNSGNNLLNGFDGADLMVGGAGNDTYFVDNGGDVVIENAGEGTDAVFSTAHFALAANVETLVLQGSADLQGYGNALANKLFGNSGNNLLDGGAGADTMVGRLGNDVYFVDDAGDLVTENPNEGTDAVFASVNFALPANVETLVLQGSADLQGYGNALANTLYGNSGNNLLDGGAGADAMAGGAGNDVYFVDNAGDVVIENVNEGNDTVFSTAHFQLSANVETLVLQGNADLQGYGNSQANELHGNSGNNLLDGRGGADTMFGGAGNDAYFVDDAGDLVIENANEGNDTVFSTAHLRLSANVENLVLQGSADLQGYGNGLSNAIYGNSGNNILDGDAGADVMVGGAGNDVYFVDNAGDVVIENANEGNDIVFSTAHFQLSANVETLVLQGNADLQGYGNSQANELHGNSGNNLLNGEGGADTMFGGAGNDAYFVDDGADLVFENPGEGTDTVFSTVDYTLTANVETLVLQGNGNLSGTGNELANGIFGNSGNNTLDGGAGADVLTGDAGNDTFVFHMGQGDGDVVVDFAGNGAAAGDSLQFVGYGAGATFTQNDTTHWQVNFNGGTSHEVITFMNGASIDPTDVVFM